MEITLTVLSGTMREDSGNNAVGVVSRAAAVVLLIGGDGCGWAFSLSREVGEESGERIH